MKLTTKRGAKLTSLAAASLLAVASSCNLDLSDVKPAYDPTSDVVYKDAAGYKNQLAKVYASFALTGSQGPAGNGDIKGIDEGTSDYIRQYWSAQELTTDEAVIAWGDPGVQDWHNFAWTSSGVLIRGLYSRLLYTVTLANSYLQQSTNDMLASRGISTADQTNIANYRAEARFLRALAYYHALDLYGNVPFADETFVIGGTALPTRISRADLYKYLESELLAISADGVMKGPRTNEYGRADQAAAWALLAKMYLNAATYTGTANYAGAATYAKKVIDAGYSLYPNATSGSRLQRNGYARQFLADNNVNNPEIIFPIVYDGKQTQSYGGTTFLTHAAVSVSADANWSPVPYGIGGGWGGTRTTSRLFQQFADTAADERGSFHVAGQTLNIVTQTDFQYGFVPFKWRNVTAAGQAGSDVTFPDTDFPMLRLADMYLTYAEASARSGNAAAGLQYVNAVRNRAFHGQPGGTAGAVAATDLTANNYQFFLDERSRELQWEATRRTDLIRFGKFTGGTYLWPWKGGVANGTSVDDHYQLFPIPSSELSINSNLTQNPGY